MSDSVRSHRRKPTRLPCPWDSPGKNTGVGCHFLLQCMKVKEQSEVAQSCPTLSDPMDYSLPGSSIHGIFQARVLEWGAIVFSAHSRIEGTKISRVQLYGVFEKLYESESHSVLSDSLQPHGIYSPWNLQARILEWVAFPFSRESSQTRDQTRVSCISGGFVIS